MPQKTRSWLSSWWGMLFTFFLWFVFIPAIIIRSNIPSKLKVLSTIIIFLLFFQIIVFSGLSSDVDNTQETVQNDQVIEILEQELSEVRDSKHQLDQQISELTKQLEEKDQEIANISLAAEKNSSSASSAPEEANLSSSSISSQPTSSAKSQSKAVSQSTAPAQTTPQTPTPTSSWDHSGNNYNCSDFSSYSQAKSAYDESLVVAGRDIHRLDGDNDGIPCESLQ
jgi:cell division protein FtsB